MSLFHPSCAPLSTSAQARGVCALPLRPHASRHSALQGPGTFWKLHGAASTAAFPSMRPRGTTVSFAASPRSSSGSGAQNGTKYFHFTGMRGHKSRALNALFVSPSLATPVPETLLSVASAAAAGQAAHRGRVSPEGLACSLLASTAEVTTMCLMGQQKPSAVLFFFKDIFTG